MAGKSGNFHRSLANLSSRHMIQRRDKLASPLLTFPNQICLPSDLVQKQPQLENKQTEEQNNCFIFCILETYSLENEYWIYNSEKKVKFRYIPPLVWPRVQL